MSRARRTHPPPARSLPRSPGPRGSTAGPPRVHRCRCPHFPLSCSINSNPPPPPPPPSPQPPSQGVPLFRPVLVHPPAWPSRPGPPLHARAQRTALHGLALPLSATTARRSPRATPGRPGAPTRPPRSPPPPFPPTPTPLPTTHTPQNGISSDGADRLGPAGRGTRCKRRAGWAGLFQAGRGGGARSRRATRPRAAAQSSSCGEKETRGRNHL